MRSAVRRIRISAGRASVSLIVSIATALLRGILFDAMGKVAADMGHMVLVQPLISQAQVLQRRAFSSEQGPVQ